MAATLRYSRQRERIYEYLSHAVEHPSAEMIFQALRPEIPNLSLGTVYRNLNLLEQLGKIRRVSTCRGNERYDAICHDHAHFICQECDTILDLEELDGTPLLKQLSPEEGYGVSRLDIILTGRCPRCSRSDPDH